MKALQYFENNISLAERNNDKATQILAMELAAKSCESLGEHKKTLEYFYKILALNPDIDDKMGVYGDMGSTYTFIGDYTHALTCYINSLKLLDEILPSKKDRDIQDTLQKAGLLLNIGDIYLAMKQPDKAFENYNNVLNLSKAIKDQSFETWGLYGIGKAFNAQSQYSKAIETFNAALAESKTINSFNTEVDIWTELAEVYIQTDSFDKAVECAENAIKLSEERNFTDKLPKVYVALGKAYLKQQKYELSVQYLQNALTVCQATGALEAEQNAFETLSTAYEKMNQPAKALYAYRNFITVRDSVYNIATANRLTQIDLQYTFDKKQIEDTAVYNEKIQRQRIFTYASFAGAALVLLLSFFIYRNYDTQRKYNALLKKEQERQLAHISAQDTVLSDIAHVQSHFVRGPIATIIGLLQFYNHEDPTDPLNKEIIQGVNVSIEKLDNVVKDLVAKENKLRRDTNT